MTTSRTYIIAENIVASTIIPAGIQKYKDTLNDPIEPTFFAIKHNIAEFRKLSPAQVLHIKHLSHSEKVEIIELYNRMFDTLHQLLEG